MIVQIPILHQPFPFDTFHAIIGGSNWVLHRRTRQIVEKYGENVICLSQEAYKNAERLAWLLQTEGYD